MFLVIVAVVIWLIFLVLKNRISRKECIGSHKTFYDIPGPTGFPIVGNISLADDCETWNQQREMALKYYPIYRMTIYNLNFVYILKPEDIECVLNAKIKYHKGPLYNILKNHLGKSLVVAIGKEWHKRRKLLTKSFHFNVLSEYLNIFNKGVKTFVEEVQDQLNQPIDVRPIINTMTLNVIQETIFGEDINVKEELITEYRKSSGYLTELIGKNSVNPHLSFLTNIPVLNRESKNARNSIRRFGSKILEEKLSLSPETSYTKSLNMLDILISNPDVYDNEFIIDEINTFIFAGLETSSAACTFMLLALANYPECQDEVYKEIIEVVGENGSPTHAQLQSMNYLDRVLKETLRMFTPVTFIARQLEEELVLKSGYLLHPGTVVLINFPDIHNNPNNFPNPEIFDPDRFLPENSIGRHPYALIPFSAGSRNCIAQKFVTLELKHVTCKLLQKFRLEPVTLMKDLVFVPNLSLQTKKSIKIKFLPRQ